MDLLVDLGGLVSTMGAHLARTGECPALPRCVHGTQDLPGEYPYCQLRGHGGDTACEDEPGIPGVDDGPSVLPSCAALPVAAVVVIQCLRTLEEVIAEQAAQVARGSELHDTVHVAVLCGARQVRLVVPAHSQKLSY